MTRKVFLSLFDLDRLVAFHASPPLLKQWENVVLGFGLIFHQR